MIKTQVISPLRAWVLAARPKTLPAAVGPVLVGIAIAANDVSLNWLAAAACLLAALLLQVGSNFANDYFDFMKGADPHDRRGPTRATAAGLISPASMRWGMAVIFGLATLIGIYLVWVGGTRILIIGVTAILAALLYSGGPLPYGYYGLGELFVFLFFGLAAVVGTYYVQTLTVTPTALWSAIPVGALITAILVVNNLRDLETDKRTGKRTLAVLLGKRGTQYEFALLLVIAFATSVLLGYFIHWALWLPLLALPLTIPLVRSVWHDEGQTLNKTLAGVSRLSLVYSLLLAVAWLMV